MYYHAVQRLKGKKTNRREIDIVMGEKLIRQKSNKWAPK